MFDGKRIFLGAALAAFSMHAAAGNVELTWVGCEVSKAAYIEDLGNGFQQTTGSLIHMNLADSTRGIRDVQKGKADLGILVCGTGIGMSIVANKFPGVRAALAHDLFTAQMAKEHNNANVLGMGGRILENATAKAMVDAWLDTAFEAGRHQRRLDKIAELEQRLCKEKC